MVKSKSGRTFYEKEEHKRTILVHDRANTDNISDIAYCAALAFHKSIIGLSELSFLESATEAMGKRYRSSIAVQTYYIVYQLFCGCMLLDPKYEIKQRFPSNGDIAKGFVAYEIDEEALNTPDENAFAWNNCKDNEMDMATYISHGDIKKYCKVLRKEKCRKRIDKYSFLRILYECFVSERKGDESNKMLYERLDYIRDRSIYRPSVVVKSNPPFGYAQTSNEVRQEIDSLPSSADLFDIVKRVLCAIKDVNDNKVIEQCIYAFNNGFAVDCNSDHLRDVGYTWKDVERIGGYVSSYIYQLMELFEPKDTIDLYNKFWSPIFAEIKD